MTALPDTAAASGDMRLPIISVVSVLAGFAAMQIAALMVTGGVFEYPLDDVYIHLAIAEEIAAGGYGVNSGEYASAASSPLYPLLLTPWAGTGAQRWLPLFWNTLALAAAGWIWGHTLVLAGYGRMRNAWPGYLLAALGLIAVNGFSLAYMGMEHTLHLAASLAILCGLVQFVTTGGITAFLVGGVFLSPALRLEGLALALAAAGVVALLGRWRAGVGLGLLALLPAAAFAGFLMSIGLGPVSSSIEAKLGLQIQTDADPASWIVASIRVNLMETPGLLLMALSLVALLAAPVVGRNGAQGHGLRLVAYAVGLAGLAQLAAGKVGWPYRYEVYILATLVLGIAAVLGLSARRGPAHRILSVALALLVAVSGAFYLTKAVQHGRWATNAIHLQQAQMARFVRDYARRPVAVNDIGRIAWGNDHYVLDLFGLASDEARRIRFAEADPHWAGTLAAARDVDLAMIYDNWFGPFVGPDWVRLGTLEILTRRGVLGGWEVSFYATRPEKAPELVAALRAFAPTLPPGAVFRFEAQP